jgi:hypothetical protein
MKLPSPIDSEAEAPMPTSSRLRVRHSRRRFPTVPAIVVRGRDGTDLIENVNADERDGTFFGPIAVGTEDGVLRMFSVHNVGTAPLKLGHIGIEGSGADEFELTASPAREVAPGASTTFTVRYRGSSAGSAVALVLIPSNDATERPYLFLVERYAEPASPTPANTHPNSRPMKTSAHSLATPRTLLALALVLALTAFATAARAGSPAPFSGTVAGRALGVPASETNPYLYKGFVWGAGPSTLGQAVVAGHHTTYADTGSIVNGLLILSTRQGMIFGTYAGSEEFTLDPTVFAVTGTMTFTGGTGRCHNAAGSAAFSGALTILNITPAGIFQETMRLTYSGSLALPDGR